MKRSSLSLFTVLTILVFSLSTVSATGVKVLSPDKGLIKDVQKNYKEAQEKLLALAEAIPEKDYSWRPAKGIRSVSEALMHIAIGNLFIPKYLGFQTTEKVSFDMEKSVTEKADVITFLKKSFEFNNQSFSKIDEKSLGVEVDFFNKTKSTKRGILLLIISHNHEHLGQLIAYARSVGVVPPWSIKK